MFVGMRSKKVPFKILIFLISLKICVSAFPLISAFLLWASAAPGWTGTKLQNHSGLHRGWWSGRDSSHFRDQTAERSRPWSLQALPCLGKVSCIVMVAEPRSLGHLYFLCSPYSICSPARIPTCCLQRRSQTPPPHSSQGPTSRFLSGLTVLDVDETPFRTDPPSSLERNSPFEAFIY